VTSPQFDLIVVDKDPYTLEYLERVFQCVECNALYLSSEQEALAICQTQGTQVFVTEIQNSVFDGDALARAVRKACPDVVLFAMTALEFDDHMDGLLFQRVFYKPLNASQMAAHINLALLGINSMLNRS
jgi:DNA-binding response OmpR family regulator